MSTYAESMNNMSTIFQTLEQVGIDKTTIVNMFWPELYDQMIQANNLIKELNKQAKLKDLQQGNNNQQSNQNNDMMGMGGSFGGFGGSPDMNSGGDTSLNQLEDLADNVPPGNNATAPPA